MKPRYFYFFLRKECSENADVMQMKRNVDRQGSFEPSWMLGVMKIKKTFFNISTLRFPEDPLEQQLKFKPKQQMFWRSVRSIKKEFC